MKGLSGQQERVARAAQSFVVEQQSFVVEHEEAPYVRSWRVLSG
ncbi:hypothetical protein [Streptomyces sp. Ru73]|nr:hypothetical protein [Streptomyces sp. Ru73]